MGRICGWGGQGYARLGGYLGMGRALVLSRALTLSSALSWSRGRVVTGWLTLYTAPLVFLTISTRSSYRSEVGGEGW